MKIGNMSQGVNFYILKDVLNVSIPSHTIIDELATIEDDFNEKVKEFSQEYKKITGRYINLGLAADPESTQFAYFDMQRRRVIGFYCDRDGLLFLRTVHKHTESGTSSLAQHASGKVKYTENYPDYFMHITREKDTYEIILSLNDRSAVNRLGCVIKLDPSSGSGEAEYNFFRRIDNLNLKGRLVAVLKGQKLEGETSVKFEHVGQLSGVLTLIKDGSKKDLPCGNTQRFIRVENGSAVFTGAHSMVDSCVYYNPNTREVCVYDYPHEFITSYREFMDSMKDEESSFRYHRSRYRRYMDIDALSLVTEKDLLQIAFS